MLVESPLPSAATVTLACGTTAPVGSVTRPVTDAVCANATETRSENQSNRMGYLWHDIIVRVICRSRSPDQRVSQRLEQPVLVIAHIFEQPFAQRLAPLEQAVSLAPPQITPPLWLTLVQLPPSDPRGG